MLNTSRSTLLIAFTLCACSGGSDKQVAKDANAAPAATTQASAVVVAGTPNGGLEDWVREIRDGTAKVPEQAAKDQPGALKTAMDLYIGRQEYIEMYWGKDGKISKSEPLAQSVVDAESRFHELLQLAQDTTPDIKKLSSAVDALSKGYDTVLDNARHSGVPLDPWKVSSK